MILLAPKQHLVTTTLFCFKTKEIGIMGSAWVQRIQLFCSLPHSQPKYHVWYFTQTRGVRPEERRPVMLCRIHFRAQLAAQLNLQSRYQSRAAISKPGLPSRGCCGRSTASQSFCAFSVFIPNLNFCLSFCLWPEIRSRNFSLYIA